MKKLSDRAAILLALIIDYTHRNDAGELTRYWIPVRDGQHSKTLCGRVWVGGSGDAAAIRALKLRGLIEEERVANYASSATEDGILHFERHIREHGRLDELRRIVAQNEFVMRGPQDETEA